MTWRIEQGDCLERMVELPDASIDAVVTDPPYGLEFMGKDWDRLGATVEVAQEGADRSHPFRDGSSRIRYGLSATSMQEWHEAWAREALRVLKPGGHLLAFGGTRTYHRLACAIEDAGFEILDCLMWLYGSGFPKSLNLDGEWRGWGTALKPAWEPIVVARRPLAGTVAGNVLAHGTGALNVDGCRIGFAGAADEAESKTKNRHADFGSGARENAVYGQDHRARGEHGNYDAPGRWPANVVLSHSEDCVLVGERQVRADASRGPSGFGANDGSNADGLHGHDSLEERHADGESVELWACVPGCPVRALDDQAGDARSAGLYEKGARAQGAKVGAASIPIDGLTSATYADAGGPSRFFYCAKTSRAERNAGLAAERNAHPTVKPIDLMRWLVRLVTPPGGTVLDPFVGSGTTGCAGVLEGLDFVGIEREADYIPIAEARITFWAEHPTGLPVEQALAAESRRRKVREIGQLGLL